MFNLKKDSQYHEAQLKAHITELEEANLELQAKATRDLSDAQLSLKETKHNFGI